MDAERHSGDKDLLALFAARRGLDPGLLPAYGVHEAMVAHQGAERRVVRVPQENPDGQLVGWHDRPYKPDWADCDGSAGRWLPHPPDGHYPIVGVSTRLMDAIWFGMDLWVFRHIDDWLASISTHAQMANSCVGGTGPLTDVAEDIAAMAAKAPEGFKIVLCNPSRQAEDLARASLAAADVGLVIVRINADWSRATYVEHHAAAVGEGMSRAAEHAAPGSELDLSLDWLIQHSEQAAA